MRFGEFKQNIDFSKDTFATIGGVKGRQFGRDVYSTVLKFKDLEEFLQIFPTVQRDINKGRVSSIKKYILSGLKDKGSLRFFSAITATCKGIIIYDDDKQRVAIDVRSKMSLNDGQHRHEGIKSAIKDLENLIKRNERDMDKRDYYKNLLEELQNMVVPVIIFDGLGETEEKQLFYDLNNLAQRPSRSANIKLSQTDLFAVLSREVVAGNRYLQHYGVEMDKVIIGRANKNTFLLAGVYNAIKELVDEVTEDNFDGVKEYVSETFDKLFFSMPHDINDKEKYFLSKNYGLVGIARFISDCRNDMLIDEEEIFDAIHEADFTHNVDVYGKYGAVYGSTGNIVFNSSTSGAKAVYSYLKTLLETKQKNKDKVKEKQTAR